MVKAWTGLKGLLPHALPGLILAVQCLSMGASAQTMEDVRASLATQDRAQARTWLEQLTAQHTSEGDAYLYLGTMQREDGDLAAAIQTFQQGLYEAPDHLDMRAELAMTLAWEHRFADSIAQFDLVLEANPQHRAAMMGRARVLAWSGHYAEADAIYDAALMKDPHDEEALRGSAMVDRMRLRNREARTKYETILASNPDDQEAQEGLRLIEETSRLILEMGGGAIVFSGADTYTTFLGEASFLWTPEVAVFGRYQNDGTSSGLTSLTGSDSTPWGHQVEVGVRLRPTPKWNAGVGYMLNLRAGAQKHLIPMRAGRELPRDFVVLAGLRPGFGGDARRELLSDLGLQWLIPKGHWLMGQAFHYLSAAGDRSWTLVGTGFAQPVDLLGLKAGGGYGLENGDGKSIFFAEVSVSIRRVQLIAFYDRTRVSFSRHSAYLKLRVHL